MSRITIDSDNLDDTRQIGQRLGAALACSHVVALIGPLGSGKTTLVKSMGHGAGVADHRRINSPSFVIVNEYDANVAENPLHIYHIDAYRLRGDSDLDALGFDEMCSTGAVIIEWADRVTGLLPDDLLTITFEPIDQHRRRLYCSADGPASRTLLAALPA